MRRHFFLFTLLLLPGFCRGQKNVEDDFKRYAREQEAAFSEYVSQEEKNFKAYYDSINREFAQYLAETWLDYPLKKKEPPLNTPIPPAIYKPDTPRPKPTKQPIKGKDVESPLPPRIPKPDKGKGQNKHPLPKLPVLSPYSGIETQFYGTPITLKKIVFSLPQLAGTDEKSVAAYWIALARLPYTDWSQYIRQLSSALQLNDWGMYQLINRTFETYFPERNKNEQTIFAVFTLNQLGFKAKIGRAQHRLVPLIAFNCNVFNTSFFRYGNESGTTYSVVNAGHDDLSTIQSCRMEYGGATRLMDMSLSAAPALHTRIVSKVLNVKGQQYNMQYDENYMRLMAGYPCIDFHFYAESALSNVFLQSIDKEIRPVIQGKSQEEAINFLLSFVQYAFDYQTDHEQFGYERWFFPEETVASAYSDCEDRAILFSQLVRRLLGMEVVLIYYPGKHLATAVKFDNPNTQGDYLTVDGKKFLICDPTYIGATLGMGMPSLMKVPIEVVRLKKLSKLLAGTN